MLCGTKPSQINNITFIDGNFPKKNKKGHEIGDIRIMPQQ